MAETVLSKIRSSFWLKTGLLIFLIALADILFLGHAIGWTPAFFGVSLLAAVILTQPYILASRKMQIGSMLLIGLILSMVEHSGLLNIMLFGLGLGALTTWPRRQTDHPGIIAKDVLQLFICAPFRSAHDIDTLINVQTRRKHRGQSIIKLLSFMIIPAFLSVVFIFFFATANPLFAELIPKFNIQYLIEFIHPLRLIFWGMIGVLVWCLLRPRINGRQKTAPLSQAVQFDFWLSRTSVVFSLILFNMIFAVQNGLDILFLWSGQALPNAMTYAEYAQTGAYTLIFTILLAAGYVLFIFSDKHRKYQSTAARYAVYLWIVQNVFLLISSAYRNSLYIDAYSLTYLRLFAFIWMGIIAIGLLLIILRIYLDRNNTWLIRCNIAVVLAVLYVSCFVNYSSAIAHYNVRHAKEITGQGSALDIGYITLLGADALPALDWFIQHTESSDRQNFPNAESLYFIQLYQINTLQEDWRQWTWRQSRIASEYKTEADIFALMDTNWVLQKPDSQKTEDSSDLKLSIGDRFWASIENKCSIASTQINANETDLQFRKTEARDKNYNPECADDNDSTLQLTRYLVNDFASVRHWQINDGMLILSDAQGDDLLRFSKPDKTR